jgi:hypothetical protein
VRRCLLSLLFASLLFVSCAQTPQHPEVVVLASGDSLEGFRLSSLSGARDGDRLEATAVLTAPESSLTLEMSFKVGVPTRLESGGYRWIRLGGISSGSIAATSVTFLGGQSDPPNLGGVFQLFSDKNIPSHRVVLPVSSID